MNEDKPLRKALGRALNLISYRQRTERELRERLGERFESDVIDRAVGRLKEQGLVNDEEFARAWSDGRTRNSPRSARALVREMTAKGVSKPVADAAVLDLDDEETARRVRPSSRGALPGTTTSSSTADCGSIFSVAGTAAQWHAGPPQSCGVNMGLLRDTITASERPTFPFVQTSYSGRTQ